MPPKSPMDFSEVMKMFDPEQMSKFFNPETFMNAFKGMQMPGVDMQAIMEQNRANMEAVAAANKAAAEAYKEFYEMQMSIFQTLTKSAEEHARSFSPPQSPETLQKQSEVARAAVEKGFKLMAELAEANRKANQQTYKLIEKRVDEAVGEIKKL